MKPTFWQRIKLSRLHKRYLKLFTHQKESSKYYTGTTEGWHNNILFVVGHFKIEQRYDTIHVFYVPTGKEIFAYSGEVNRFWSGYNLSKEIINDFVECYEFIIKEMESIEYP
jgi:hypothetical protein